MSHANIRVAQAPWTAVRQALCKCVRHPAKDQHSVSLSGRILCRSRAVEGVCVGVAEGGVRDLDADLLLLRWGHHHLQTTDKGTQDRTKEARRVSHYIVMRLARMLMSTSHHAGGNAEVHSAGVLFR